MRLAEQFIGKDCKSVFQNMNGTVLEIVEISSSGEVQNKMDVIRKAVNKNIGKNTMVVVFKEK